LSILIIILEYFKKNSNQANGKTNGNKKINELKIHLHKHAEKNAPETFPQTITTVSLVKHNFKFSAIIHKIKEQKTTSSTTKGLNKEYRR
jgi:hypothetical protein